MCSHVDWEGKVKENYRNKFSVSVKDIEVENYFSIYGFKLILSDCIKTVFE
jgi:hypothetical protein